MREAIYKIVDGEWGLYENNEYIGVPATFEESCWCVNDEGNQEVVIDGEVVFCKDCMTYLGCVYI